MEGRRRQNHGKSMADVTTTTSWRLNGDRMATSRWRQKWKARTPTGRVRSERWRRNATVCGGLHWKFAAVCGSLWLFVRGGLWRSQESPAVCGNLRQSARVFGGLWWAAAVCGSGQSIIVCSSLRQSAADFGNYAHCMIHKMWILFKADPCREKVSTPEVTRFSEPALHLVTFHNDPALQSRPTITRTKPM